MKQDRTKQIILPCCQANGYLRASSHGTKHFVHKHKTECDWKPETWQHLLAKTEIVRVCQQLGYEARTEVTGSDWRADVLATKPGKQGLISVAFEVQWSPQTESVTKERQAKYQRDGIRGCLFFAHPPSSRPSRELPIFELALSEDSLVVHMGERSLLLSEFIEDLLTKRIRFCTCYRLKPLQSVRIMLFPVDCWNCWRTFYIYSVELNYLSCCGKVVLEQSNQLPNVVRLDSEMNLANLLLKTANWGSYGNTTKVNKFLFAPEILIAVREFIRTVRFQDIKMGEIKNRYSQTNRTSNQNFGCPWCGATMGQFYYF